MKHILEDFKTILNAQKFNNGININQIAALENRLGQKVGLVGVVDLLVFHVIAQHAAAEKLSGIVGEIAVVAIDNVA